VPSSSAQPSLEPSDVPSQSSIPSLQPSVKPSISTSPSLEPSESPSTSTKPSLKPTPVPVVTGDGFEKVFVTSETYDGDLGGIPGADAICQALACSAGLVGIYKAWLSDGLSNPANDFVKNFGPGYRLVDGTIIANNFADLTDGFQENPIKKDENGDTISSNFNVWTNTNANGTTVSNDRGCESWSSPGGGSVGQVGDSSSTLGVGSFPNQTDSSWTLKPGGLGVGQLTCDNFARLYCFQQDGLNILPGTYFIVCQQVIFVYVYTNKFYLFRRVSNLYNNHGKYYRGYYY